MDDPGALIATLFDGLPITIKSGLLNKIATFYCGQLSLDASQADAIISDAFAPKDVLNAPRAIVFLCASIDHVLIRSLVVAPLSDDMMKRAAQDTGSKGLASVVLGMPLQKKHLEQAQRDWSALRSNQLSARRVAAYECNFLVTLVQSMK